MKLKMLCTCGAQSSDTSPIIDVEKVLQDYAWREFRHLTPWLSGVLIRRSDYIIDVQWNFFEFDHVTPKFEPRPITKDGFTEKKTVELYSTNFKNDTGVEQSYKFKIQRQTKATTSVTYQRGFTIRGNANFKISIPAAFGDCGVSAGVDGQLSITKSTGETFEEVFTWETDNDVTVESNHVTCARMLLTEDELVADFEVKTSLRMPSGQAPIVIRRRRDNEIQAVCLIDNLAEVFASYEEDHTVDVLRVKVPPNDIRHVVKLTTTGVIRAMRWRDQKICLQSRPLPQAASKPDAKPILDLPTDDLVDLNAKEIYAHVIRHVTGVTSNDVVQGDGASDIPKALPPPVAATPSTSTESKKETRLMKFPTIPTIVTEVLSDNGGSSEPQTNGTTSESITEPKMNTGPVAKRRTAEDKPRLERGVPCVDGSSPPRELSPKTTLTTLQARRAKLAKVTSV